MSLRTTKEYSVPMDRSNRNTTLTSFQGNPLIVLGTSKLFLHVEELVRHLEVIVVEKVSRDNEILIIQHTEKTRYDPKSSIKAILLGSPQ